MINKNIIKELENNKKGNKIFSNQETSDLDELETILKEREELVVNFPIEEWNNIAPILMNEKNMTQLAATRSYVALKVLKVLSEKYPQLEKHRKNIIDPIKSNLAYTLNYLKVSLEIEDIHPERIHFIMNGNNSKILCDAISLLLSDEYPFDVSIYTSPNVFYTTIIPDTKDKVYIWQAYNYTSYNKTEVGKENVSTRPKVKKYEKV